MQNVQQLDHLNMSVTDLDASLDWYGRVFGFERVEAGHWQGHPWAIARAGEAMLCLYELPEGETPEDGSLAVRHFGIRIKDRENWERTIAQENLEITYGEAWRWPHSTSWYLSDPSGHQIEVVLWDNDEISF